MERPIRIVTGLQAGDTPDDVTSFLQCIRELVAGSPIEGMFGERAAEYFRLRDEDGVAVDPYGELERYADEVDKHFTELARQTEHARTLEAVLHDLKKEVVDRDARSAERVRELVNANEAVIAEYRDTVARLAMRNEALAKEKAELADDVAFYRNENNDLHRANEDAAADEAKLRETIEGLRQERAELRRTIVRLEQRNGELEACIEAERGFRNATNTIEKIKSQNAELLEQRYAVEEQIVSLRQERDNAEDDRQRLAQRCADQEATLHAAQAKVDQATHAMREMNNLRARSIAQAEAEMTEQADMLQADLAAKNEQIDALRERVEGLEGQVAELSKRIVRLLAEHEDEAEAWKTENAALRQQVAEADQLRQDNDGLRYTVDQLRRKIGEQERDLQRCVERRNEADRRLQAHKDTIAEYDREIDKVCTENAALREQNAVLRSTNAILRERIVEVNDRVDELQARVGTADPLWQEVRELKERLNLIDGE
jgi:chromosome segregation ATPase